VGSCATLGGGDVDAVAMARAVVTQHRAVQVSAADTVLQHAAKMVFFNTFLSLES
jgi:hypothetical protein